MSPVPSARPSPKNCGSRCWSVSSHGRRGGALSIPANLHVGTYALRACFSCVGRGLKARMSYRSTGCRRWRSLAVDGGSETSRGHAHQAIDPLLRTSVCSAGQPACPQVSRCIRLSGSDRETPILTGRSGTQRARQSLRPELRLRWSLVRQPESSRIRSMPFH
jgi:hypothetical protein